MIATAAIQIEHVPIDQLRPDPANPRKISDTELEALTRSMQQFGLVDPVIARREDGLVVGGHQRLLAARKLGIKTVPVVYVDLSLEQAQVLNFALNKISGSWDDELLARMSIEGRNLKPGTVLVARYKKQDHRCEVVKGAEGKVAFRVKGKEYGSPSAAGSAVMGGVACLSLR
jgi:ParB-like chromosome segregation protein Spo0J